MTAPTATGAGRPNWAAYLAASWALLFAVPSIYWALGGTAGLDLVSTGAKRLAVERQGWFVLLLWVTAAGKVLAGVLALSLVRSWGRLFPHWLRLVATGGLGAAFLLYGVTSLVRSVPALTGSVPLDATLDRTILRWYVFAWQPFWVLGGLTFLAAAVLFHRGRAGRPRPHLTQQRPTSYDIHALCPSGDASPPAREHRDTGKDDAE